MRPSQIIDNVVTMKAQDKQLLTRIQEMREKMKGVTEEDVNAAIAEGAHQAPAKPKHVTPNTTPARRGVADGNPSMPRH